MISYIIFCSQPCRHWQHWSRIDDAASKCEKLYCRTDWLTLEKFLDWVTIKSLSQEISYLLWNPEIHYSVYENPPPCYVGPCYHSMAHP